MLRIFRHFRLKDWLLFLLSAVFIFLQVWLELKLPDYMNEVTALVQTPGSSLSEVGRYGALMTACAVGSLISAIIVCLIIAVVAASFSQRLRSKVFDKVNDFSMSEIKGFSVPSLITRSTNDITQVQMFITMGIQSIIKAPIMVVWAVVKMSVNGYWQWSFVAICAVFLQMLMFILVITFVLPKFKKMQILTDNINRVARENLTGLRVVRAYNAEEFQHEKFQKANTEITDTSLFTSRAMALMMPFMNTILSGLSLAIFWIGAYLIDAASMGERLAIYSNMVVFSAYAVQIIFAFMLLVMVIMILPRASVAARRIDEVLKTKITILDGTEEDGKQGKEGEIEFKNVCFKYPDASEYVLENINFSAKKGETVAFIGSTGSGKSTLISLIPRFFDATSGEVLFGGRNITEYKLEHLYDKIGYVPQKAVIFRGSVNSNVAFGEQKDREITDDDIKEAVRIAESREFVENMTGGYEADVSQGGSNISGGQKQRLSIARAIARKPEVYIFDDSFSALDYNTDKKLRNTLKKETADVTTLIVAQRIGTIMNADKIIVLNEGKIVGCGKHKELLESCDVYRQIATSQLSEEELGA